jgi:hypothetical protein
LSSAHVFAVLPLTFVDFALFIYQLSIATSLPIKPVANVIVAVGIDKPPKPIINIIHKLAFVNNVVDFFTDSSHFSVLVQLADDVLIVFRLSKLH